MCQYIVKEIPEPFPLPHEASVVKVAAGWAHCVSVTGILFYFGLRLLITRLFKGSEEKKLHNGYVNVTCFPLYINVIFYLNCLFNLAYDRQ